MAKLSITEYSDIDTHAQAPMEPAIAEQSVTFTTSTQSSALNGQTDMVRLCADADAYITFGTNPSADGDSEFLPARTEIFRMVPRNASIKIAAYDGTS